MKVNSTTPIHPVHSHQPTGRESTQKGEDSDRVTLSADAEFVQSMREQARLSDPRQDVVSDVRAQIADGSFEGKVDMDRLLDSLLADL